MDEDPIDELARKYSKEAEDAPLKGPADIGVSKLVGLFDMMKKSTTEPGRRRIFRELQESEYTPKELEEFLNEETHQMIHPDFAPFLDADRLSRFTSHAIEYLCQRHEQVSLDFSNLLRSVDVDILPLMQYTLRIRGYLSVATKRDEGNGFLIRCNPERATSMSISILTTHDGNMSCDEEVKDE